MADITITRGTELAANTLFYPPVLSSDLLGNKASDWVDGNMPVSRYEAILKARATGQPLWDTVAWEAINTDIPMYSDGSGPQQYNTVAVRQPRNGFENGFEIGAWLENNWKWSVPLALGVMIILTRK